MQQPPLSPLTVLRATASADLPALGLKRGGIFYLVFDSASHSIHLVQWDRIHWLCSCKQGACTHKRVVNDFVFEESQQHRITGDDLAVHIEDDLNC